MSVELPKDAEGREIPLETKVMYGYGGTARNIVYWVFTTDSDLEKDWRNCWRAVTDTGRKIDPGLMHLTPPDSWEKLEEDLGRASGYDIIAPSCRYFTAGKCVDCRMRNGATCGIHKNERAFADILERIHKLRGED